MTRRTVLTLAVVSLVLLAGCSTLSDSPSEPAATPDTATTDRLTTAAQTTGGPMTETTTQPPLTATRTATPPQTTTATETAIATPTATQTAMPTATATPTPTPTATPTATDTPLPTPSPTTTPMATPTETPERDIGPEPPLDAESLAAGHEEGLRTAGSFVVNASSTVGDTADRPDRRSARVDLDANTAYQVSRPTEEATRYTYAEGATAYKKEVLAAFEEPSYEVDELGRPLTTSLIAADRIYETVRAVDYERSGTVTRDGQRLAVYVANGTDSVTTDVLFRGEDITAFSSTLVLDPETGVVHTLKTERTTDELSAGESVTIEETLRFSELGSVSVDQPAWVTDLKEETDG